MRQGVGNEPVSGIPFKEATSWMSRRPSPRPRRRRCGRGRGRGRRGEAVGQLGAAQRVVVGKANLRSLRRLVLIIRIQKKRRLKRVFVFEIRKRKKTFNTLSLEFQQDSCDMARRGTCGTVSVTQQCWEQQAGVSWCDLLQGH